VVLDLMTVKFMSSYMTKPIYLFGLIGVLSILVSFVAFIWAVVLKYFYDTTFIETPLPVLCAMFLLVGVQFILMGLLSEILMRTYHESQDKRIYILDERAEEENFEPVGIEAGVERLTATANSHVYMSADISSGAKPPH
jgi:hypothetical protein